MQAVVRGAAVARGGDESPSGADHVIEDVVARIHGGSGATVDLGAAPAGGHHALGTLTEHEPIHVGKGAVVVVGAHVDVDLAGGVGRAEAVGGGNGVFEVLGGLPAGAGAGVVRADVAVDIPGAVVVGQVGKAGLEAGDVASVEAGEGSDGDIGDVGRAAGVIVRIAAVAEVIQAVEVVDLGVEHSARGEVTVGVEDSVVGDVISLGCGCGCGAIGGGSCGVGLVMRSGGESWAFGVVGSDGQRPWAAGVLALDIVQPFDIEQDALEMGGNRRVAVVGEARLVFKLVLIDRHPKRLFNNAGRRLHIDQEAVIEAMGDGEPHAGRPVDHGLFVLRGGAKPGNPLLG